LAISALVRWQQPPPQEHIMNTNRTQQIRTATFVTVVAFVACASTTAPAFAGHSHGDGEGGSGASTVSPYSEPIPALDGLTLAEYIHKHQAGDPRTATMV
jgi:hypothetical protein